MRDGVESWETIGGRVTIGFLWTGLAVAEAGLGTPDKGLDLVD